jgi:hypothetical protein
MFFWEDVFDIKKKYCDNLMHCQSKKQNLTDECVNGMIEGLWNSAKMVEYELVAHVKREEANGSKDVKDGHSSAKDEAKVEADHNHGVKSLEVKLF